MIRIERNSLNLIVVTLSEKVTVSNPTFLFSFISQGNSEVNFIANDVSITPTHSVRRNKFYIREVGNSTGTIDYTSGTVQLLPDGQWSYVIYAQDSSGNLNPVLADEVVETGIVEVIDSSNPKHDYDSPTDNTDTYSIPNI